MAIYVPAYYIIHLIHVHCFDGTQNKLHRYLDFFLILDFLLYLLLFFNFITFRILLGIRIRSHMYMYNYDLRNKWAKITGFLLKITCFHFSIFIFQQSIFSKLSSYRLKKSISLKKSGRVEPNIQLGIILLL